MVPESITTDIEPTNATGASHVSVCVRPRRPGGLATKPADIDRWCMNIEGQGRAFFNLEGELLEGGARLRLYRASRVPDGLRQPLCFLTIHLRPPVMMRGGMLGALPDRIFEPNVARHDLFARVWSMYPTLDPIS